MALALAACGDAGEGASADIDVDVNPLPVVARSDWDAAQQTCEGMMSGAVEYGVADGQPDLLVAIGSRGVVCVDTFPVFENELGADSLVMHRLWLRYMATLQELGPELAIDQQDQQPLQDQPGSAPR
ncbi:MAG: hypothetical protein R3B40_00690 [Polyangiales bacterium]|nr:hypothetical protein [Myxococcales bacterium]